jgi:hypothetical protein
LIVALIITVSLFTVHCRNRVETIKPEALIAVEPENYSATIVLTIEDGDRREVIESRTARMGEMRREEWIEAGERRALIFRPDLNRNFLLSLDRQLYVESPITPQEDQTTDDQRNSIDEKRAKEIDRAFDASPPEKIETVSLPDETIDGHLCRVIEKRVTFAGGSVEVSRIFLARDLAGLAVRIETASSRIRTVTERRNVRQASADQFAVPAGFKRVERLP